MKARTSWRDSPDVRGVCAGYGAGLAQVWRRRMFWDASITSPPARNAALATSSRLWLRGAAPRPQLAVEPVRPHATPAVPWEETLDTVLSDWRGRAA